MKKSHFKLGLCVILIAIILVEVGMLIGMIYANNRFSERIEKTELSIQENEHKITVNNSIQAIKVGDLTAENEKLRQEIESLKQKDIDLDRLIHSNQTIVQGVNREQLRTIIKNTLKYLGEKNIDKKTDLLMITAQIESDLGYYYKQVKGPAVGIFQMEPATEKSIWEHYLKYRPELAKKIKNLRAEAHLDSKELEWNVAYATAMTNTLYKWRGVDPSKMTPLEMLYAYKKFFNTYKGKTDVWKAMEKKLTGSKTTEGRKYVAGR